MCICGLCGCICVWSVNVGVNGFCLYECVVSTVCLCVCVCVYSCLHVSAHMSTCVCGQRGSPTLPDDSSMENTINSLTAFQLFPQWRLKSPNWNEEQLGTDKHSNQMFHWSNHPAAPVFTLGSHSSLTAVSWALIQMKCFLGFYFFVVQSQLCIMIMLIITLSHKSIGKHWRERW